MTIRRTTNWSEEGALHIEVTEDPIAQPDGQTDRQTVRQTNAIFTYDWTSVKPLLGPDLHTTRLHWGRINH